MKTKLIIGLFLVIPKLLFADSLQNINNECEIYNTKYSEKSSNSKQFFCNGKKHKKRYQEDQNHEDDLVIVL